MATVSKTFTENQESSNKSTWTVSVTGTNQMVSGNFTPTLPTVTAKYVNSGKSQGMVNLEMSYSVGSSYGGYVYYDKQSSAQSLVKMTSGTPYSIPKTGGSMSSITLSNLFKASNKTVRTVNLTASAPSIYLASDASSGKWNSYTNGSTVSFGTVASITLDVPPTATVSNLSIDTPYIFTGLTTASVTVSNSAAYYGGDVTDVTLMIGNQSDSLSGDGTLSILLDTAGTFTPTVIVTDSRGQTKSYQLDPITVNAYTAPTVSFDVDRTNSSGQPDDEGTYCLMAATLTFTDVIATALAPSVVATDETGTQTTPTVTWYTDDTLTTTVTWSSLSSGDTVYGMFSGVNTQYSYQVSVTPRDSEGTGDAIVQTISSAFYTVDFLAGGHGIAFGQPASQTGFYCNMDTHILGSAEFGDDVYIDLPDYQTADTTDKAIYDAVVALGWDSDVLVN